MPTDNALTFVVTVTPNEQELAKLNGRAVRQGRVQRSAAMIIECAIADALRHHWTVEEATVVPQPAVVEDAHIFESTGLPCAICGAPHREFTVPSSLWNRVMRPDGREVDNEYLCLGCFLMRVQTAMGICCGEPDPIGGLCSFCPLGHDYKQQTVVQFTFRPPMTGTQWRALHAAAKEAGAVEGHVNPPQLRVGGLSDE